MEAGFSQGLASEGLLRTRSGRMADPVFCAAHPFSGLTVWRCDSDYRTSELGPEFSTGQPLPP